MDGWWVGDWIRLLSLTVLCNYNSSPPATVVLCLGRSVINLAQFATVEEVFSPNFSNGLVLFVVNCNSSFEGILLCLMLISFSSWLHLVRTLWASQCNCSVLFYWDLLIDFSLTIFIFIMMPFLGFPFTGLVSLWNGEPTAFSHVHSFCIAIEGDVQ